MAAMENIPGGLFDMVLIRLPDPNETKRWTSPIPLSDFVELNGERYEYSGYLKLMHLGGLSSAQAKAFWQDFCQEGVLKKCKDVLKPDGIVIALSTDVASQHIEENKQIPLREVHYWYKSRSMLEKAPVEKVMVFSLYSPCQKGSQELPKNLMYLSSYKNCGKDRGEMPTPLLKNILQTYTLPGQRVLDFTAESHVFAELCGLSGRNYVGISKNCKMDKSY